MQLRSVAGETHAARTGAEGDLYNSPGKRASRLNFFHVYGRTALQRLLPAPAPAACPSASPVRCRGPAPSRSPRAAPTWPGQQPSLAGLSVPPPRCSLGLAPADPQGRGREQTRVGGAGAEAEGRAQREEAAEPRSPGRPLPLSIPASGRRAGRGRRSPASGGEGPAGPGRVWATRGPREGVPQPSGVPSPRTLEELSECGSWTRGRRDGELRRSARPRRTASWREAGSTSLQVLLSYLRNLQTFTEYSQLGCLGPDTLLALRIHFPIHIMNIEGVLARVKGIQRDDPPTPLTTAPTDRSNGRSQIARG